MELSSKAATLSSEGAIPGEIFKLAQNLGGLLKNVGELAGLAAKYLPTLGL